MMFIEIVATQGSPAPPLHHLLLHLKKFQPPSHPAPLHSSEPPVPAVLLLLLWQLLLHLHRPPSLLSCTGSMLAPTPPLQPALFRASS
ncbi:hypothetical protein NPIL_472971 [Nephila pilipes]|uniref:Uncharacterized protein n=1 Tax=Nephila pilipes TaxID=299642 RepID=A0A8X6UKP9_NEPPI|nr:hypothetical protein NPIL_472971 [Nephila pilipes]